MAVRGTSCTPCSHVALPPRLTLFNRNDLVPHIRRGSTHYIGRHQSGAETKGSCSRCRDQGQYCKDGSLFATALGLCAAALRASRRKPPGSLRRPQVGLAAAETAQDPFGSLVSLFNRNDLVPHIRETILASTPTHIHVITGPRSCGKTRTMEEAIETAPFVVSVKCRAKGTGEKETFYEEVREDFRTAASRSDQWWQRWGNELTKATPRLVTAGTQACLEMLPLPEAARNVAGIVTEEAVKMASEALSEVGGGHRLFSDIDAAIQKIHANRGRLVIYIDELNVVQSKGDPEFKWMDKFTQDLMRVLIQNTKERARAIVLLSTSDQQYAALMKGKADFEMHCLGYMGVKEIDEFLKIDWEGDPAVEREEDRQKIIDSNGGFFPGLAKLRRAAKDGRLDETIENMQLETNRGLKSRLMGIPQPKMAACKKALQNISKDIVDRGYASYDELLDSAGGEAVGSLVDQNLVQLRYAKKGHEGELWAPDLPEAARSIDVVTPYLPIDRKWLREL